MERVRPSDFNEVTIDRIRTFYGNDVDCMFERLMKHGWSIISDICMGMLLHGWIILAPILSKACSSVFALVFLALKGGSNAMRFELAGRQKQAA